MINKLKIFQKPDQTWIIFGHLGMLVLLLYSGIYYLERTLFIDTAYQLFNVMNFEQMFVSVGRYSDYIVKAPAWIAVESGASVKGVLMTFSIGIVAIYYLVFILCTHLLKNRFAGIAVLLNLIVAMRQSFYHPMTETHQALVYCCLFWAWLYFPTKSTGRNKDIIKSTIAILIAALAFFAHPIAALLLGFVLLYWVYDKKLWKNMLPWVILAGVICLTALKISFTETGSYEGQFFGNLTQIFTDLPDIFNRQLWGTFMLEFKRVYFFPTLLMGVTLLLLVLKKSYWKAVFLLLFSLGMFIIVEASSPVDSYVMMEKNLLPWAFIILMFFVKEVLEINSKYATSWSKMAFVGLITVLSFSGLSKAGSIFTKRLNYMDQLIEVTHQKGTDKLIAPLHYVDAEKVNVGWAYANESLMYSIVKGKKPTTIYVADQPLETYVRKENPKAFVGPRFGKVQFIGQFNPYYFSLDSTKAYKVLDQKVE